MSRGRLKTGQWGALQNRPVVMGWWLVLHMGSERGQEGGLAGVRLGRF